MPIIAPIQPIIGGWAMIDANPDDSFGSIKGISNFKVVRNFVLDMRGISPAADNALGVRWDTGEGSHLSNIKIIMTQESGNTHRGISSDLANGGTVRNATLMFQSFAHIQVREENGFTFSNLNCFQAPTAIFIATPSNNIIGQHAVNAIVVLDSSFYSGWRVIETYRRGGTIPGQVGGNSVMMENVTVRYYALIFEPDNGDIDMIGEGIEFPPYVYIANTGQGIRYVPPNHVRQVDWSGDFQRGSPIPASLQGFNGYYFKSKPQYLQYKASDFISVRTVGAKGDGVTDDTIMLQRAIDMSASTGKPVWVDYGIYYVTRTLLVRGGTKIVGEVWPRIMAGGSFFANEKSPQPVFKFGNPGDTGTVEISDISVITKSGSIGAISYQWNINSAANSSGMWDTHSYIGGFDTASGSKQTDPYWTQLTIRPATVPH
ncbi:hypothetical protein ABW19_dt0205326 [Dactylella cylindrospora]|nr:hypothetical protein ABW19_dt0205326 [Dactylella cylindrospora]